MNDLAQFTGTEAYHAFTPFYKDVLTDGTKYFAESRQCFWLFVARQTGWTDLEADQMFFAAPYDYYENGKPKFCIMLTSEY